MTKTTTADNVASEPSAAEWPLRGVVPAQAGPPPAPPTPPRITQRVLLVEDRETHGVGTGFLAATLRSMGYEVTEAVRTEVGPAFPDIQLLVLGSFGDEGSGP